MSVQTTQTLDIKNFQSYSSVNDTDKVLMTKNGADASITIALLREILSRNVKPTIIDGVWHIGAVDTGIKAIGKSPQFQTSANGIEWRYEGDTAWIPLVSYDQLKLKFSDLTPEQFQSLKLTLADLTAEEIAELQRPATETIESVKKVGTDATAAEKLRVGAEEKRVTNETARTTKESERLQAETSRVNAEENRASAEILRTGNETTRVSKETERITSEGERTTSETARNTKESERITAESGRVTAETARVTAESERVLLFKTLKTDSENTTALASEVASHPTYVGVDNYVYVWNKTTKAYDKTTIYVKGEGVDYTTLTPEEKNGLKGLSAYDVAVGNGYVGAVEQWLLSLKGDAGIFDTTTKFTELDTTNKTIVGAINELKSSPTVLQPFKFDAVKLISIRTGETTDEATLLSNGIFISKAEMIRYITDYFNEDSIDIVITFHDPSYQTNYFFTEVFQKNKEPLLNNQELPTPGFTVYSISFKFIIEKDTVTITFKLIHNETENIFAGQIDLAYGVRDDLIQTKKDRALNTTSAEIVGAINELHSGRAKTDLSNVTLNKGLASNGYYKAPDGLLFQWGESTGSSGHDVYFPISFFSIFSAVATVSPTNIDMLTGTVTSIHINSISISGFRAYKTYVKSNGTSGGETSSPFDWIAIGTWK